MPVGDITDLLSGGLPGSPRFAGGGSTLVLCAAATVKVARRATKSAFIVFGVSCSCSMEDWLFQDEDIDDGKKRERSRHG